MSKQSIIAYDQSCYSKNKINCLYIYIPHPYFKNNTTQKFPRKETKLFPNLKENY